MKIKSNKRLYRSREDRQIAGVCGGVADYLGVDPTLVRLVCAIFAIAGGPGVLLYMIMAVIVPEEPEFAPAAEKAKREETV